MAADTIPVSEDTAGTLAQVGTELIGGVHYQKAMIADGADPTQLLGVDTDGRIGVVSAKGTKTVSAEAPDTTAAEVLAANADRKVAFIQNVGSVTVYLGVDNTVTTSTGLELVQGAVLTDAHSEDAWYGITASGTADLRVVEIA